MVKSFRPEGWEKIKQGILPLRFESLDPEPFRLIEAGADALLNSLRQLGNSRGGRVDNLDRKGTWVFLLDDEAGE